MLKETLYTATDIDGGHVFSVGKDEYFVPRSPCGSKFTLPHTEDFGLACVIQLPKGDEPEVTADWVQKAIETYEKEDDVFGRAFLATVVFHGAEEDRVDFTNAARKYLDRLGNEQVVFAAEWAEMLPGPYVVVGNELRDVWKLVSDANGTCMATLKPQLTSYNPFEPFEWMSPGDHCSNFALQSRIKTRAASESPIAGLRIVVKDNIHIKGIRTSVGNRAFYNTYPPRDETADCIDKLLRQGVVVAGKTKMNSFGNWEEPLEQIDYQAPWNPRADKYQSTGGSSSGSAAAVAAYDWLDIAIGTDTWGSVTRPSLWCGCFGLRPSLGTVSTKGIEPFCQAWDTAGFLGRDLEKCRNFAAAWLDPEALEKGEIPFSSVLWPDDYWSIISPEQVDIARAFVDSIKTVLEVDCEQVSFARMWAESPPNEANKSSLPDFINEASKAQCYDAYHNSKDFIEKHLEKFKHAPYVSPPNQGMWEFAKTISKEKRDEGFERMDVYTNWFKNTILTGKHSNGLIIMPLESMAPRYRDQQPTFKRPPQNGVNALGLAAVLGSPVLAVPIAEIPYHSRITGQTEKLPFTVAIMSKPGTDLTLMDKIHKVLSKTDRPTVVKTGKSMFS